MQQVVYGAHLVGPHGDHVAGARCRVVGSVDVEANPAAEGGAAGEGASGGDAAGDGESGAGSAGSSGQGDGWAHLVEFLDSAECAVPAEELPRIAPDKLRLPVRSPALTSASAPWLLADTV